MPRCLSSITLGAALALLSAGAIAQNKADPKSAPYPSRPVRVIVPNTPGSATDGVTRLVTQRLTELWGQQVVVDNRAGASGIIGHEIAAKSAPDGYTLLVSTSAGLVIAPILQKLSYDSMRDFAPISLIVDSPQMLVGHPGVPASNVEEVIALARAKPGQLHCASPGTGTSNHLGCEMLKVMTKVDIMHVPYKGTGPAITGLMGGQVQLMFNSMPAVYPLAKAGKLKAIAHGGLKRSPAAPEVPTVAETIPGFQVGTWYALLAPRGTPPAIVSRVNADLVKVLSDPTFAKRLIDQGQDPQPGSPATLMAHMKSESARWANIIKTAGLTIQ